MPQELRPSSQARFQSGRRWRSSPASPGVIRDGVPSAAPFRTGTRVKETPNSRRAPRLLQSHRWRTRWRRRNSGQRERAGGHDEAAEQHDDVASCGKQVAPLGGEGVVPGTSQHGEPPGEQRRGGGHADADAKLARHVQQSPRLAGQPTGAAAMIEPLLGEMKNPCPTPKIASASITRKMLARAPFVMMTARPRRSADQHARGGHQTGAEAVIKRAAKRSHQAKHHRRSTASAPRQKSIPGRRGPTRKAPKKSPNSAA